MKTRILFTALLVALLLAVPAWSQVSFSIGLPGFYLSVGNFFGYPQERVHYYHGRGIPDDDLPVLFFISRQALVEPDVILDLRIGRGWSWGQICEYYRIPPDVFYYPVQNYGPPYGHAYGYYKNYRTREDWRRNVRLQDIDVVNQVNLIFISKHYGYPPERVINMRDHDASFVNIERRVYREKEGIAVPSKPGRADIPKLAPRQRHRVVLQSRILMERDPLSLNSQMCIPKYLLQPKDPKSKEDTKGLRLRQLLHLLRERAIREKERVIKEVRGREKIGKSWGS